MMTTSPRLSVGARIVEICEERSSVHRTINQQGRDNTIVSHASHQGNCLPFPVRSRADQSFTTRAATPQSHHVCAGGSFVNKHQPGWVKETLLLKPAAARAGDILSFLFTRAQSFFDGDIAPF